MVYTALYHGLMKEVGSVRAWGTDLPSQDSWVLFLLPIPDVQTKQRRLVIATIWIWDYTRKCLLRFSVMDHVLNFIGMIS